MRGFGKTRKILFWAAAVLVCIRLLFVAGGRVEREPYDGEIFEMEMDSSVACTNIRQSFTSERERLRNLYLIFEWVEEKKEGTLDLAIYKGDAPVLKVSVALSSITPFQWKELPLNLPLEPGVEYTVQIKAAGVGQAFPSICTTRAEIPLQGGVLGGSNIQGGNLMIGLDLEPPWRVGISC